MQVWCLKNTDKFNFEKIEAGSDMNKTYKGMVQAISNFKEALITSKDLELWLAQKQKEIDKLSEKEKKKKENKKLKKYVEDHKDFNKVYSEYEKFQKKTNIFDFDDMVAKAINLFKKDSTILENYQEKYDYILVDEFQDNNYSQYEIIKMLGAHGNVMVVGDDAQSIYSWRGADMDNILSFPERYPDAQVYRIEKNPLPWMEEMLNGVEHANFFENRSTEYSKAATQGTWEEAFE